MKKNILILFVILYVFNLTAFGSETDYFETNKLEISNSFDDFQEILNEQDSNIIVLDEKGLPLREYHSNSRIINYIYDESDNLIKSIDNYGNESLIYSPKPYLDKLTKFNYYNIRMEIINPNATTATSTYFNYYVNSYRMNNLITNAQFRNSATLSDDQIQTIFENNGTILKDRILVYRQTTSGTLYFDGTNIIPSDHIGMYSRYYDINPKLILCTLQKESSLVSGFNNPSSFDNIRLVFAMGVGKTDGGTYYEYSGFDKQIKYGAMFLSNYYDEAISKQFPLNLPDGIITSINYGSEQSGYKNNIWVDNVATYALYRYTPHVLDIEMLPTITGGNYLLYNVLKGGRCGFTNWD